MDTFTKIKETNKILCNGTIISTVYRHIANICSQNNHDYRNTAYLVVNIMSTVYRDTAYLGT